MIKNLVLCCVIATVGSVLASILTAQEWRRMLPQQSQPPARIMYPKIQNHRVDACLNSRTECGQPAADAFCRDHGYAKAVDWKIDDHVAPTMTIGTGVVCNEECNGFVYIVCDGRRR